MPALPAPSGRNAATNVHRKGAAQTKAMAHTSATSSIAAMPRSRRTATSPFHGADRAQRDREQDRDAHDGGGRGLAVAEILVRFLEDVIEQQVGGIARSTLDQ